MSVIREMEDDGTCERLNEMKLRKLTGLLPSWRCIAKFDWFGKSDHEGQGHFVGLRLWMLQVVQAARVCASGRSDQQATTRATPSTTDITSPWH